MVVFDAFTEYAKEHARREQEREREGAEESEAKRKKHSEYKNSDKKTRTRRVLSVLYFIFFLSLHFLIKCTFNLLSLNGSSSIAVAAVAVKVASDLYALNVCKM